jgi:putative ABC transport system permease protein
VVFAFMLVLMVWGLFDSMNHMLEQLFGETEQWDLIAVFDQPQTEATLRVVRGWEGVQEVEPALQLPVTLRANGREEDVLLTALAPGQEMHMLQLPSGISPREALDADQLVLASAAGEELGVAAGDRVSADTPFGEHIFTISAAADEVMGTTAYMALDEAQAMIPLPTPVFNTVYVSADAAQARQLKRDLYHLPGVASVRLKSDLRQEMEELLGLFYAFMGVMLVFALAMASALIFNAMTVNVLERQRELATMRAIGTGGRRIAVEIVVENVILWLLALVPGLLLGRWMSQQMGAAFSAELFTFDVVIAPLSYALTAGGILLTMILATLPAVRRVNRLDLAEATKILT